MVRPFTWSSKPNEGLADCSAMVIPSHSDILRPWVLIRPWGKHPQPHALQSSALPTELVLTRLTRHFSVNIQSVFCRIFFFFGWEVIFKLLSWPRNQNWPNLEDISFFYSANSSSNITSWCRLNFIQLLRVVITPSVTENDSKQSDEFQATAGVDQIWKCIRYPRNDVSSTG